MTTDRAMAELRKMLAAAGFAEHEPELAVLWPVFKAWAAVPAEGARAELAADTLLFDCSLDLRPGDDSAFIIDFTRQFSFEDARGDYAGMEHVSVDLRFPVDDEFRAITQMAEWSDQFGTADKVWGVGGEGALAWAAQVEESQSYQTALRHRAARVGFSDGPA